MENARYDSYATFAPLVERFGRDLACTRDGALVSWSLDGQTASIIARRDDQSVGVTFFDRPMLDACRSVCVSAAYRPRVGGYPLAHHGVSAMVDDLLAFFTGVREPRFDFVGLEERL